MLPFKPSIGRSCKKDAFLFKHLPVHDILWPCQASQMALWWAFYGWLIFSWSKSFGLNFESTVRLKINRGSLTFYLDWHCKHLQRVLYSFLFSYFEWLFVYIHILKVSSIVKRTYLQFHYSHQSRRQKNSLETKVWFQRRATGCWRVLRP